MSSLAEARKKTIQAAMQESGSVVISTLARELHVSEMTIRRDLRQLETEGVLVRVHGGAIAREPIRYGERLSANAPAKAMAVEKLEPYLPTSGTIYLDGSTTMLGLVGKLHDMNDLQVATNNVETFHQLIGLPGVEPVLIGGQLDRRTDNLVGALARRSVLAIAFDAAFFSCYGLTCEHGPMEATLEDAEVKDIVATRARSVYIAVDEGKLGRVVPGAWRPDAMRSTLATNLVPEDARLEGLQEWFSRIL